jgi:hypothetical protein
LNTFPVELKSGDNLVHDTVKRGENDEDVSSRELPKRMGRSVIIRVYDALGGRGKGIIETTWSVSKVFKTNLLEDDGEEVPIKGREVQGGPKSFPRGHLPPCSILNTFCALLNRSGIFDQRFILSCAHANFLDQVHNYPFSN